MKLIKNLFQSKNNQIIMGAVLLLLLSMGCVYYILAKNNSDLLASNHAGSLELDPNAGFFTASAVPGSVPGSSQTIQLPGYESLTVTSDGHLQAILNNPYGNPCYFRFSISLTSGALLYQSQLVPPGQAVPYPSLDQTVLPGKCQVILRIESFALGSQAPMNGAKMTIPLYVIT